MELKRIRERLWAVPPCTFNRTRMELKHGHRGHQYYRCFAFNRTRMELKPCYRLRTKATKRAFNRTRMELKLLKVVEFFARLTVF